MVSKKYLIPARYNSIKINYDFYVNNRKNNNINVYKNDELDIIFPQFNFSNPLVIEVGCGTGEFLFNAATINPIKNFIGIDVALPCIQRAVNKMEKTPLNNLLFYHGLIEDFLFHDFSLIKFDLIMVNFPDPWFKKKHLKRRIIKLEFVKKCYTVLKEQGNICTATDVYQLFKEHLEIISEIDTFKLLNKGNYNEPPNEFYQYASKYQKKNLTQSSKVYYTHHMKN